MTTVENGTKIIIMSPVVHGKKGEHKELLDNLRKQGFIRVINETTGETKFYSG